MIKCVRDNFISTKHFGIICKDSVTVISLENLKEIRCSIFFVNGINLQTNLSRRKHTMLYQTKFFIGVRVKFDQLINLYVIMKLFRNYMTYSKLNNKKIANI